MWGGLFLRATDGDPQFYTDYGFPFYNDHHFHLGYFLYALAYYVRHDRDWGNRTYLSVTVDFALLDKKDTFSNVQIVTNFDIHVDWAEWYHYWDTGIIFNN